MLSAHLQIRWTRKMDDRLVFRRLIPGLVGGSGGSVVSLLSATPWNCNLLSSAGSDTGHDPSRSLELKILIATVAWCLLFVLCWPLALLVLVLWPIVWLLALPFRLVGITFSALFAFLQAILFLPARVLGWRPRQAQVHRTAAA
jgi:hypothetical protein